MSLFLSEKDVAQLLTMELALEAVESAHRAHALGRAVDIPRQRTRIPACSLHILQGALLDEGVIGYKAYSVGRAGAQFYVHVFDAEDGKPLALIAADYLGMMRTGAAAAVAAKYLSRAESATVGMIGSGWQAQSQLAALCQVRKLEQVKLYSRDAAKRQQASERFSARFGLEVVAVPSAEGAVRDSDIVVTITSATTPVLLGEHLAEGCHINAAGSNALNRRELDEAAVSRASLICVDSCQTAMREAGDLLPALEKGRLHERQLIELGDIVTARHAGRQDSRAITLFESQGMAIQDLALATRLIKLAQAQGIGSHMPS